MSTGRSPFLPEPHFRDGVAGERAPRGVAQFVFGQPVRGRIVRADGRAVHQHAHQFAAEHDGAAAQAGDDDVEAHSDAGPEVNLEHRLADPQALGSAENALAERHARGRIA